jgi:hypothetical protein
VPTPTTNFGVPLPSHNTPVPGYSKANEEPNQDPPTTSSWTCDPCKVTLDSEQALKSHKKSHVKCSDCSFEGSPQVVKGHYQATHGKFSVSGFKTVMVGVPGCRVQRFRICVGNRPEDIQRWIEDRKKRFPRQKRPEDSSPAGKGDSKSKSSKVISGTKETADVEAGMSSLLAGYGSSSGSDEEESTAKPKEDVKEKAAQKPVEATTPEEQDGQETRCTKDHDDTMRPKQSTRPCRYFMRNGTCLNGDKCRFSHEITSNRFPDRTKKRKRGSTSSDSLLRKLLENDVQREATLTMQLLGYIVDCNFFEGNGSPPSRDNEKSES